MMMMMMSGGGGGCDRDDDDDDDDDDGDDDDDDNNGDGDAERIISLIIQFNLLVFTGTCTHKMLATKYFINTNCIQAFFCLFICYSTSRPSFDFLIILVIQVSSTYHLPLPTPPLPLSLSLSLSLSPPLSPVNTPTRSTLQVIA